MIKFCSKNKKIRTAVFAAVLAVVFALMPLFAGCSFLRDVFGGETIRFTRSSLILSQGDTFDLSGIIDSESASYDLSSSNRAVATVDSRTRVLKAVSPGVAYITAETSLSECDLRVTVTEKQPDMFTITAYGEPVQTVGETSKVSFVPTASGIAAKTDIAWYVNGRFVKTLPQNTAFEYVPTSAGIYIISAQSGGMSAESVLRVYNTTQISVTHTGELIQDGMPFTDIVFTVSVDGETENPENYIRWYDGGDLIYDGDNTVFEYSPAPGRHTVSVNVNGIDAYSVDVICRGSIVPSAPTVSFDNLYPHVYVEYETTGNARVEITSLDGTVAEYDETDTRYADMFDPGRFDVGDLISLCASSSVRRSYRFRVKSLGDGDMITESSYSPYYDFIQLPSAAEKYVSTVISGGDLYVTSEKEYVSVAEHYIFFRNKTKQPSAVSFDCYIAYDRRGSALDLWNDAFPLAATSGMYTKIYVYDDPNTANVMRTSFNVSTVNTPVKQSVPDIENGGYSEQLHAVLPHINYDPDKYRSDSHVFPIDLRETALNVVYSDELYAAAQGKVRPVPQAGSPAAVLYALARDVLRKICTDDMTDVQKAHAIYDWIMWKVTYDTPATYESSGEALSAYYLEGVFGDGNTKIGGIAYSPYAVCDGMSKAYSLMCNIEGIPCVRVIGKAGKSLAEAGGHAWNKVYIDGAWYVVDCTWGDSVGTLTLDGMRGIKYELGLHDHLFLTDTQVSGTHFEPYTYGETSVVYAPRTSRVKFDVYSQMDFNGTPIDCTVSKNENQIERIRQISAAFARSYVSRKTVDIPGGENGGTYAVDYQGFEIYAEDGFVINDGSILSVITTAVRSVLPRATVRAVVLNDVVLALVRA